MVVFLPEVPGWEVSSWRGSTHSLVAPKKKKIKANDVMSKGEVILSIIDRHLATLPVVSPPNDV